MHEIDTEIHWLADPLFKDNISVETLSAIELLRDVFSKNISHKFIDEYVEEIDWYIKDNDVISSWLVTFSAVLNHVYE
jgi:hypothetical protein